MPKGLGAGVGEKRVRENQVCGCVRGVLGQGGAKSGKCWVCGSQVRLGVWQRGVQVGELASEVVG